MFISNVDAGQYLSFDKHVGNKVDHVQNIEGMVKKPFGTGENSMMVFGPNCAVVSFLAATNPGSENAYLSFLKQGL